MSSPDMFGGLRSLGVCVELLVTVVTSSPLVPSVATGDLWDKKEEESVVYFQIGRIIIRH